MKLRNPLLIRIASVLAAWLVRLWIATLRIRLSILDDHEHPADHRRARFIYAFWHESLLFPMAFRAKVHVLISHHADGEFIAKAVQTMRAKVVRGSTSRGGTRALLQLMQISKRTHLLVTPDGPRGPRRRIQLGLIFLASHTGLPIIPCGVAYRKAWRAKSWDRFAVPVPFTTAYGVAGEAIHVPPELTRPQLEEYRLCVERQMLHATHLAEGWANEGRRPVRQTRLHESPSMTCSA